jgi:hypothetical protein
MLTDYRSLTKWRTPAMIWGVAIGGALTLFMSDIPVFKRDVLRKIPVVSRVQRVSAGSGARVSRENERDRNIGEVLALREKMLRVGDQAG